MRHEAKWGLYGAYMGPIWGLWGIGPFLFSDISRMNKIRDIRKQFISLASKQNDMPEMKCRYKSS